MHLKHKKESHNGITTKCQSTDDPKLGVQWKFILFPLSFVEDHEQGPQTSFPYTSKASLFLAHHITCLRSKM